MNAILMFFILVLFIPLGWIWVYSYGELMAITAHNLTVAIGYIIFTLVAFFFCAPPLLEKIGS
jgi:hypothetical protein